MTRAHSRMIAGELNTYMIERRLARQDKTFSVKKLASTTSPRAVLP